MKTDIATIVLEIPAFLFAIVFHEAAHAWMALRFGDKTAKDLGRLTLNPVPHIDPLGTILMPLICASFSSVMFGWAKPVPINASNFQVAKIRKAIFWSSFAGPLANIILVVVGSFLLAILYTKAEFLSLAPQIAQFLVYFIQINIILAVFNLVPLPPLDGSRMVGSFLTYPQLMRYEAIGRYSFFIFLVLIFTPFWPYVFLPFTKGTQWLVQIFCTLLA